MFSLVMAVSVFGCAKSDNEETQRKKRETKEKTEAVVVEETEDETELYTEDIVDTKPVRNTSDSERVEVTFGTFNGEPIEWLVLDDVNGLKLLLSKYVLCDMEMNQEEGRCSWERSALRRWLNGEFFYESFTEAEKEKIQCITLNCFTDGTADSPLAYTTNDFVFLLAAGSFDETPLSSEEMLGVSSQSSSSELWWLLSAVDNEAYYVDVNGNIGSSTDISSTEKHGVRPVILVRDLIAGPIVEGSGQFSDSDCGRLLDLMYSVTGQDYETAVRMVEEYFGTRLENTFTMQETIRGEAPTDSHLYYTKVEDGTVQFNEETFACNQGDGRVCRISLAKSNSDFLESAYAPQEFSQEETEAFFYELCDELESACGTPTLHRANRDATEVTVTYSFGPDCEIFAEYKNLDNGHIGVEVWFSNNSVKE